MFRPFVSRAVPLAIAAMTLAAACFRNPSPDGDKLKCSDDDNCLSGYRCARTVPSDAFGICVRGDAATTDAPSPSPDGTSDIATPQPDATDTRLGGSGGGHGTGGSGGIVSGGGTGGTVVVGSGGSASSGGTGGTVMVGSGGSVSSGGTGGTVVVGSGGTVSGGGTGGTVIVGSGGTGGRGGTGGTVIVGSGGSAGAGGTGSGGTGGGTSLACASALPPITDYTVLAGPFATTTENSTGPDGACIIYRPKTLGENGFLHAPIVFGPGIGMQASQLSGLLSSFASHGYVVIGTGVLNGGPNDPANKAAMQNALDWMLQQNDKAGTYQGKLATKCAISMGYSVGGTAAVEIGGHAAVATTVSIHGHVASSSMHGPLFQTSGSNDTVGRPMQQQTFDKSQVATAFGTVSGADHGYIQSDNGGVERPAIIAWMRYWINGDTGARSYFWGSDCVLCKSPWMDYKTKNWPP